MSGLKNSIFLYDQFDQQTSENFTKELMRIVEDGHKEVTVYINSYGGSVYSINAILDVIEKHRIDSGITINTVALGIAASGGSYLLLFGDKRYVSKNTTVMTHGVQAWAFGSEKQIKEEIKEIEAINQRFAKLTAQKTTMSYDEAYEFLSEDRLLDSKEAIKLGFADGLWEDENVIEELIDESSQTASMDDTGKEKLQKAKNFLLSLKKSEGAMPGKKVEENGTVKTLSADERLTLKTLEIDNKTLIQEKEALTTQLSDSKQALVDFKEKMKEAIIVKTEKTVQKDRVAEVRTDLEDMKDLAFDKFEKYAEKVGKLYSVAVPAGIIPTEQNFNGEAEMGDDKKSELDKKLDREIEELDADENGSSLAASYGVKPKQGGE